MKLNAYLNFAGKTEEAFNFYASALGLELGPLQRFKDVPGLPGKENFSEEDLNKVMHVSLELGENTLMGTDALESMGQHLKMGDNISLSLHPETRDEATRVFNALMQGGQVQMPLADAFWGAYFGMGRDKFGVQWMVNCEEPKA